MTDITVSSTICQQNHKERYMSSPCRINQVTKDALSMFQKETYLKMKEKDSCWKIFILKNQVFNDLNVV